MFWFGTIGLAKLILFGTGFITFGLATVILVFGTGLILLIVFWFGTIPVIAFGLATAIFVVGTGLIALIVFWFGTIPVIIFGFLIVFVLNYV